MKTQNPSPLAVSNSQLTVNNYLSSSQFYMTPGHIYFYTATILEWKHLLKPDKFKQIILDSLVHLIKRRR
ncbi:MAG TPA: hypothetical protein VJ844_03925 [Mucilaginibacter sp.]|nr:hypothetical protein [Mucilaginibacter sp.]